MSVKDPSDNSEFIKDARVEEVIADTPEKQYGAELALSGDLESFLRSQYALDEMQKAAVYGVIANSAEAEMAAKMAIQGTLDEYLKKRRAMIQAQAVKQTLGKWTRQHAEEGAYQGAEGLEKNGKGMQI